MPETPETASRLRPMNDLDTALTVAAMRPGITPGKAMTTIEALRGAGWLSPADLPAHEAMVRAKVAEEILAEVCAPAEQCEDRFCIDCIRHTQQQRDAEIARGTQP